MKRLLLLLLLIPLVSSLTTYSGETINITVDKQFEYYSIVGNTTPISLDIYQEGNTIFVTPNKYQSGDTFDLVFFDREKETVTVYRGGGSSTIYKDKNVTQYVDVPYEVIKQVDKPVDKEVIKEVPISNRTESIILASMIVALLMIIAFMGRRIEKMKGEIEILSVERRLRQNE
jgi:hypothetical protein